MGLLSWIAPTCCLCLCRSWCYLTYPLGTLPLPAQLAHVPLHTSDGVATLPPLPQPLPAPTNTTGVQAIEPRCTPEEKSGSSTLALTVCDTGEPLKDFTFVDPAHSHCHCCNPSTTRHSKETVSDIFTWALCFNQYTASLCAIYPGMLPRMMACENTSSKRTFNSPARAGVSTTGPSASRLPPSVPQTGKALMPASTLALLPASLAGLPVPLQFQAQVIDLFLGSQ